MGLACKSVCQSLNLESAMYQIFEKYKENSNYQDHENGLLLLKAADSSEKQQEVKMSNRELKTKCQKARRFFRSIKSLKKTKGQDLL